jgi:hypothetical protein
MLTESNSLASYEEFSQLRVIENAEPAAAVGALDIAKWSLLDGQIGDS